MRWEKDDMQKKTNKIPNYRIFFISHSKLSPIIHELLSKSLKFFLVMFENK